MQVGHVTIRERFAYVFLHQLGIAPMRINFTVQLPTVMQSHGPKRVYTPHSLEFWFTKLEHDWTGVFSTSQLEQGRQIYRDGEVRELELTDRDAGDSRLPRHSER